jgi:hypothetical protein
MKRPGGNIPAGSFFLFLISAGNSASVNRLLIDFDAEFNLS